MKLYGKLYADTQLLLYLTQNASVSPVFLQMFKLPFIQSNPIEKEKERGEREEEREKKDQLQVP